MCAPAAARVAGAQMCAPAGPVCEGRRLRRWARPTVERRLRLPEPVAELLRVAVHKVRQRAGCALPTGAALLWMAAHFLRIWQPALPTRRTLSQRVIERDGGRCQVPGCSRAAVHAHHIVPRSQGGSDEEDNLTAVCEAHHLHAIHLGWVTVSGQAPGRLVWRLGVRDQEALAEYRSGPDGPVRVGVAFG